MTAKPIRLFRLALPAALALACAFLPAFPALADQGRDDATEYCTRTCRENSPVFHESCIKECVKREGERYDRYDRDRRYDDDRYYRDDRRHRRDERREYDRRKQRESDRYHRPLTVPW